MLGELVPKGGGDPIPLLQPKLLVGRRSNCDIVLVFPNVSSQHCEFELINGYWQIRDLNSRNGIKVNGERCDSKWLHPGDEISIAKNYYEIHYEPSGEAPAPEEDNPFATSLLEKAGLEKSGVHKEHRRASPSLPPSAARSTNQASFDADEDAAMDWLMGGR